MVPPRWMCFVMHSVRRRENLWAAFPLNLLLALVWWVQDRWARAALAPSWIEREVRDRVNGEKMREMLENRRFPSDPWVIERELSKLRKGKC